MEKSISSASNRTNYKYLILYAIDSYENNPVGVKCIMYRTKDNQDWISWQKAKSPAFLIINEEIEKIEFYSIDRLENEEELQSYNFIGNFPP